MRKYLATYNAYINLSCIEAISKEGYGASASIVVYFKSGRMITYTARADHAIYDAISNFMDDLRHSLQDDDTEEEE